MGLKLDDPVYDEKVKELNESMREKAQFYRDQIIGKTTFAFISFICLHLADFFWCRFTETDGRPFGGDKDYLSGVQQTLTEMPYRR